MKITRVSSVVIWISVSNAVRRKKSFQFYYPDGCIKSRQQNSDCRERRRRVFTPRTLHLIVCVQVCNVESVWMCVFGLGGCCRALWGRRERPGLWPPAFVRTTQASLSCISHRRPPPGGSPRLTTLTLPQNSRYHHGAVVVVVVVVDETGDAQKAPLA